MEAVVDQAHLGSVFGFLEPSVDNDLEDDDADVVGQGMVVLDADPLNGRALARRDLAVHIVKRLLVPGDLFGHHFPETAKRI